MFTYNITFIVAENIYPTWQSWTQQAFKNRVTKLKTPVSFQWLQLIDSPNEGITVCLQLFFDSKELLQEYQTTLEQSFDEEIWQQFPNQFVVYKSTLKALNS